MQGKRNSKISETQSLQDPGVNILCRNSQNLCQTTAKTLFRPFLWSTCLWQILHLYTDCQKYFVGCSRAFVIQQNVQTYLKVTILNFRTEILCMNQVW